MRALLIPLAAATLAGLTALATVGRVAVPRGSGRLAQSVYVWQRAWTPDVRRALRLHGHSFDETVVLGAEIAWTGGAPHATYVDVPIDAVATREGVGVALRIGPSPRPPGTDDDDTVLVVETAVALARRAGPDARELQLDYDCAESALDGYAGWVAAVRDAVAPIPVTITALPSWLDRRAFAPLVRTTDGFVLQVHSVERPSGPDDPEPLCDPARALRWAEDAAAPGVPYRVALPTYGYVLGWSREGRFLGAGAEGPAPGWPRGATVRELSADAVAMASLVRRWREDRPAAMRGVIWYRLPVEGDARNWRWTTLTRAMRGLPATPRLVARSERPAPELVDLGVANEGSADAVGDVALDVSWSGARLVGWDAVPGFEFETLGEGRSRFRVRRAAGVRLAPRASRPVGWLRFDRAAEVEVHVAR